MDPDQLDPNFIEPVEGDQDEDQQPNLGDRAQDLQNKYEQGKDLYQKGKKGLKGIEKKVAQQAKRKVATQGGKVAGQAAGEVGAEAAGVGAGEAAGVAAGEVAGVAAGEAAGTAAGATAAGAAAGSVAPVVGTIIGAAVGFIIANAGKIWRKAKEKWPTLVAIAGCVLILPAIIFGLLAGKGIPQYPTTVGQVAQAKTTAALAGNLSAGRQITQANVDAIKSHYSDLVNLAKADKKTEVKQRTDEIAALLDQLVNLTGDQQKSMLDQIQVKEKALMTDYSSLFAQTGTCSDIAPFEATGKFVVKSGPNGKYILQGKMMNAAGQLQPASPDLCKALVFALQAGYKISTDTLSYGHGQTTVSNNRSLHWCGAAIDINYINDKHVDNDNADAAKLVQLWYEASQNGTLFIQELIAPTAYKQYELKANKPLQYSAKVQNIHENHVHLGGRLAAGACQ